jgi:2-dehydropantoate 2-reductase
VKILVWGAGAIGGAAGAWLKRAGHDVSFVDVVPEHVAAIRGPGLRITGPVEQFSIGAPAYTPDEVPGVWQHIFLAVKAQHTEAATRALTPHLAQDGYVLSLQNGLNENIIARIVGSDRTIGAFINFGADWMAPGEILFGGRGAVVLGELDGRMTPRLAELHAVMRDFEPDAITTPDIWSYLWGKLGYGAMLFAQALGQQGIADCLARPELLPLWRRLGEEAITVALAEGVEPRGFNGYDIAASAQVPPRMRRSAAWRRWWNLIAAARRRTRASGATLRYASGVPRWMCRSRRSPRSARGMASIAVRRAGW